MKGAVENAQKCAQSLPEPGSCLWQAHGHSAAGEPRGQGPSGPSGLAQKSGTFGGSGDMQSLQGFQFNQPGCRNPVWRLEACLSCFELHRGAYGLSVHRHVRKPGLSLCIPEASLTVVHTSVSKQGSRLKGSQPFQWHFHCHKL